MGDDYSEFDTTVLLYEVRPLIVREPLIAVDTTKGWPLFLASRQPLAITASVHALSALVRGATALDPTSLPLIGPGALRDPKREQGGRHGR